MLVLFVGFPIVADEVIGGMVASTISFSESSSLKRGVKQMGWRPYPPSPPWPIP